MLRTTLATLLFGLLAQTTIANDIWVESVDGDLSGSFAAPDSLTISVGPNTVSGDMGQNGNTGATNGLDADYFTLTVAPGQSITSIELTAYNNPDFGRSFIGYVDAAAFTGQGTSNLANPDAFLLFGPFDVGPANILPDVTGLPGPLGPGDHTFWLQETAATPVTYSFTFTVVPEPSSIGIALLGAIGLAIAARRR